MTENINQVMPATAYSSEGVSQLGSNFKEPLSQLLLNVKSEVQIAFDEVGKNALNLIAK